MEITRIHIVQCFHHSFTRTISKLDVVSNRRLFTVVDAVSQHQYSNHSKLHHVRTHRYSLLSLVCHPKVGFEEGLEYTMVYLPVDFIV